VPVFQRSKCFISLASLPVSCLLACSLVAQVDTSTEFSTSTFENLPDIDADTLPVPPRHLPVMGGVESGSANTENPFADRFKKAYGSQLESRLPEMGGVESGSANTKNPFADRFKEAYGDQLESLPPELPNTTSNLKNWREAFDGLKLDVDQAAPEISWTAPPGPSTAASEPSTREPVRVAKVGEIGRKLTAMAPKLEPASGLTLPVVNPGESSTIQQETFGEFGATTPDLEGSENEAVVDGLGSLEKLDDKQTHIGEVVVPAIPAILANPPQPDIPVEPAIPPIPTDLALPANPPTPSNPSLKSDAKDVWNDTTKPAVVDLPPPLMDSHAVASPPNVDELTEPKLVQNVENPKRDESLVWWKKEIQTATTPGRSLQSVETNGLVFFMLKRSPRLRAVSQNPLIREQRIAEAQAEFDPVSFLRSQWQDRVDPVGDTLSVTNDGTDFLDDHIWTSDLGVRKKTTTGATVELNQRLGFRNSNSSFFLPQDQGTAALSLNVTQPLLRGRGKYFNQSQILIAQAATDVSWDTLAIELQDEIQSVVDSYWRLYFDRSVFLQKQKNVERAQVVLEKLEGRSELDALPNQIARARSAVLSRKTELANARRDIRNSETDIRRLTADSDWAASQMVELLPIELPDLNIPEGGCHSKEH